MNKVLTGFYHVSGTQLRFNYILIGCIMFPRADTCITVTLLVTIVINAI